MHATKRACTVVYPKLKCIPNNKDCIIIVPDTYQACGGVVQNASGSIVAPDFDGDGLYDLNVDCLWTIAAPENYVIRYMIHFVKIEDSVSCHLDVLMVSCFLFFFSFFFFFFPKKMSMMLKKSGLEV